MRRAVGEVEFLDGPLDVRILAGNLRDLSRVNRWLGGVRLSWHAVRPFLSHGAPTSLLDVGTGAADIPRALLRASAIDAVQLHIRATDIRPEIIRLARSAADRDLEVVLAAAERIDEPSSSFDLVHSSMVLHHLDEAAAIALLAEMKRVARRAVIVNDLDRRQAWWVAALVLARLTTRNAYTRHDGPLSVRRAWRAEEVVRLAGEAGLTFHSRHIGLLGHRYALVFTT
jgi:ubiquinone/menaquinone biosynthesis C-methylase UbiE